jgi:hypothetical protein
MTPNIIRLRQQIKETMRCTTAIGLAVLGVFQVARATLSFGTVLVDATNVQYNGNACYSLYRTDILIVHSCMDCRPSPVRYQFLDSQ